MAKIEEGRTILYVREMEIVKDSAQDRVTKYYSLGGKNIAVKTSPPLGGEGNTVSFVTSDHLNSTRVLADNSGSVKVKSNYYPYGLIRIKTGTLPSRQYTGQVNDDSTNLYSYNARYYNPTTANFISADTAGSNSNKFQYALGNPLVINDPTGNDGEDTVTPDNDCAANPLSSSCIKLGPIDIYTPIQATQPLTAQPCYSQEECKANQEFAIAAYAFFGLIVGGGAVAEIGAPALFETVTMFYVAGSNLWNQFALNHPKMATGIDIGSALTTGVSPSGLSIPAWKISKVPSSERSARRMLAQISAMNSDFPKDPAHTLPRLQSGEMSIYTALDPLSGRIVGYTTIFPQNSSGSVYLNKTFTAPDFRKQGISTAMIRQIQNDYDEISLLDVTQYSMGLDASNILRQNYINMGFKPGQEKDGTLMFNWVK